METDLTIVTMTNRDPRFYAVMGPYLSRREITQELGGHMYDEDTKTWFVAMRGRVVAGWCAARHDRDAIHWCSAYVLPAHRRRGIYRRLIAARDIAYPQVAVTAVCTPLALPACVAAGLQGVAAKGGYTRVARDGRKPDPMEADQ